MSGDIFDSSDSAAKIRSFQGGTMTGPPHNEFERIGAAESTGGFFCEFWLFLCHNKKWWLTPILLVLLLFGLLIMASGTAVAPFIYTLF
jgi:hypothetical protein